MPDRAKIIGVVAAGLAAITALWFAMLMAIGFPFVAITIGRDFPGGASPLILKS